MDPRTLMAGLELAVAGKEFEYPKVKFPMTLHPDGSVTFAAETISVTKMLEVSDPASPIHYMFSMVGIGYLSERIAGAKYGDYTAAWRKGDAERAALVATVNSQMPTDKEFVLAVVNDVILGVMTHYNPVAHKDIIKTVYDNKLENNVIYTHLGPLDMTIDVKVEDTVGAFSDGSTDIDEDTNTIAALRVVNGHSGHTALRYYLYVKSGAYEFQTSVENARSRHLGKVDATVRAMALAFESVKDAKMINRLMAMTKEDALKIVDVELKKKTLRQEKLVLLVQDDVDVKTALDILAVLGQYASTRGYAAAVSGIMDPIMQVAVKGK